MSNQQKFKMHFIISITLFLLILASAVSAFTTGDIYLENQVKLHSDGKCGRGGHGWLDDCNTNVFTGSGPGGCYSGSLDGNHGIGGCYFWQPGGTTKVVAESKVNIQSYSRGTLTVWTAHYGGGTYQNERVNVYVNGVYVGTTDDNWCNKPNCEKVGPFSKDFNNVLFNQGANTIKFEAVDNGGSVTVHKYKIDASSIYNCNPGSTQSRVCGLTAVGICEFGTQNRMCLSDGQWSSWGACSNAIYPRLEICNGLDDDCDGSIDENLNCGPSLNIPDQTIYEDSGFNNNLVDLLAYSYDPLVPPNQWKFSLMSQTSPGIVECLLDSNRFLDCTTKQNQNGYSDLTVQLDTGITKITDTFRINVLPLDDQPVLTFIKSSVCEDQTTTFNIGVIDIDSLIDKIEWNFGDDSDNAFGEEVKHVYKNTGRYNLKITAKDKSGNEISTLSEIINVRNCAVHKIVISSSFVDDSYEIRPGDEIEVYAKVKNLGNKNEKVKLNAKIDELGIDGNEILRFDLNTKEAKWRLMTLKLPDDIKKKEYVVKITASTKLDKITKYITFMVK